MSRKITPTTSPRNEIFPLNIGFANLPNQVVRKFLKKGFNFTFMVIGESGLGKSTLINSLFQADFYDTKISPGIIIEEPPKTVKLQTSSVNIEEDNVKLSLTLIDTPGFGNFIDNSNNFNDILKYIDDQHEKYFNIENSLNRNNIIDTRVHCCFYFISPFGHGLKPLDIEIMKLLNSKVNIVPVIGKADSLTKKEIIQLKQKILQEFQENNIKIYPSDICDDDESAEYKDIIKQLNAAVPFAVCGANTLLEVKGNFVWGRVYPWGVVNIENPDHCDFIHLRTMLITHLQDLKDTTQEVYYEKYRFDRMSQHLMNISRKEFNGNFGLTKDINWNKATKEVVTRM